MPDYTITVKSQSTYGPYTYSNPAALKEDFLAGKLPREPQMDDTKALGGVVYGMVIRQLEEPK